ncbi:MAG: polyprenyl synthetase family protein [Caldisericia bacterium]
MEEIFISFLKEKASLIENEIDKVISQYKTSPLFPALSYSLKSGGKRLRPILLLASYSSFKDDIEKAVPFSVSIEFIHTYSLIHDDLPSIDNADTRRGRASLHKVFGEDIAVLTGDALLTLAFENMTKSKEFNDKIILECIKELSVDAGINGMVGGQVMDVMTTPQDATDEVLYYIHSKKTGSLIKASIKIGGILSEIDEETLDKLENFGDKIGLTYQVLDDIEDSKNIKEDENRVTFPKFFGIEKSKEIAANLLNESLIILDNISLKNEILKSFVYYLKSWLS